MGKCSAHPHSAVPLSPCPAVSTGESYGWKEAFCSALLTRRAQTTAKWLLWSCPQGLSLEWRSSGGRTLPEQLTGERDILFTALSLAQHPKKASCATFPLHEACNTDGHHSPSLPGQSRNRISHWQKHMPLHCISHQKSPKFLPWAKSTPQKTPHPQPAEKNPSHQ